jgi:hypothetical protein
MVKRTLVSLPVRKWTYHLMCVISLFLLFPFVQVLLQGNNSCVFGLFTTNACVLVHPRRLNYRMHLQTKQIHVSPHISV